VAVFFLFFSKKFLPISFKIQLLETSRQKQKEQRQKKLVVSFSDVSSFPVHFEFFAFCQIYLLVKETAEIER
jgi:hypothetical protein